MTHEICKVHVIVTYERQNNMYGNFLNKKYFSRKHLKSLLPDCSAVERVAQSIVHLFTTPSRRFFTSWPIYFYPITLVYNV